MSIQGTPAPGSTTPVIADFARHKAMREVAATAKQEGDSSGITTNARELSRAREVVEESAEVRAEKVAQLKAAIADGTYKADPREIARTLLERGL